jgi:hypothetical protein
MNGHERLEELQRRAYRHTLEDGLTELLAAVMLLGWAAILQHHQLLPFMVLLFVAITVALHAAKRRITFPRTGYVRLGHAAARRHLWGTFAFIVLPILVMALLLWVTGNPADPAAWRRWAPLLAGAFFGGGLHFAARHSGLRRFHIYQLVSLLLGLAISAAGSGNSYAGVQLYCLLMALVLLPAGGVRFVSFLRRYPAVSGEELPHVEP